MGYLIAITVSIGLFGAYFAFVGYEARSGRRAFASVRERFDARVSRAVFIIRHVDWSAFVGESVRTGSQKVVHTVAEGSLYAVRSIERLLTRLVRALRERRAPTMERPLTVMESLKAMRDRFMHTKRKEAEPVPQQATAAEAVADEVASEEEVATVTEPEEERRAASRPSSIG